MTCPHCGIELADGSRFCGTCGKATVSTESQYTAPDLDPSLLMIGKEIAGRYRIAKKLGEGGMGTVFRAEQISLKRAVAIKLLRAEVSKNPQLEARFNAEAEAVAKLSHPNTVNIYDFGRDADGTLFIAMEYVEGISLRSAISAGPMAPRRALYIASQVAASLIDAHAHSIVHRDLKPDNVMLMERGKQKDVARVLDFGIAKLRDDSRANQAAMTQAGDMLGTPQYMSPEQIRGGEIDGRVDVYALGCMIYEMITGRMPFEADTVMGLLSKHLTESVMPPTRRRPDLGLPPQLDTLVYAAMQKEASARPPTMEAYNDMIMRTMASLPAERPTGPRAAVVPPGAQTPPAYSAPGAGAIQPPGDRHAMQPMYIAPTPYHPPTPMPAAMPMLPMPVGTPVYSAQVPPHAMPRPAAAGGGMGWKLWLLIGGALFLVVGVLIAVSASIAKDDPKKKATPAKTDKTDDDKADKADKTDDDKADKADKTDDDKDDPWGDKARAAQAETLPTIFMPIPQGVSVTAPGFSVVSQTPTAQGYSNLATNAFIAIAPLPAGTNDPAQIEIAFANESKMALDHTDHIHSAGAMRDAAWYVGVNAQTGVSFTAVLVIYIEKTYRLEIGFITPTQVFQNDPTAKDAIVRGFDDFVHMP